SRCVPKRSGWAIASSMVDAAPLYVAPTSDGSASSMRRKPFTSPARVRLLLVFVDGLLDVYRELAPRRKAVLAGDDDPRVRQRHRGPREVGQLRHVVPPSSQRIRVASAPLLGEPLSALLIARHRRPPDPSDLRFRLARLDPAFEVGPTSEAVLQGDH